VEQSCATLVRPVSAADRLASTTGTDPSEPFAFLRTGQWNQEKQTVDTKAQTKAALAENLPLRHNAVLSFAVGSLDRSGRATGRLQPR
jgi:hypothetical protein